MAVAIDPRPTYFGDRIVITGTYAASDTSIALGDLLTSIDMAVVTPAAGLAPQNLETGGQADGTDATPFIFVTCYCKWNDNHSQHTRGAQATAGGTFFVIGRR